MAKRKFKQLVAIPAVYGPGRPDKYDNVENVLLDDPGLYAVADDGTAWMFGFDDKLWWELPALPDREDTAGDIISRGLSEALGAGNSPVVTVSYDRRTGELTKLEGK